MYKIFERLLKERNIRVADVSRETGVSYTTFTDWKAGRYTPKADKRQKIADFFGVPLSYLDTGVMPEDSPVSAEALFYMRQVEELPELPDLIRAYVSASEDVQRVICAGLGVQKGEISLDSEEEVS